MHEKQTSAIKKITLSTATYSDCGIEPTYINFFFGNNGSGKTTISRAINAYRKPANQLPNPESEDGSIEFETGKFSNDYNILVYNQDFIEANIQKYGSLPGVFTMNEHNITTQNEIAAKEKKTSLI